MSDSSPSNASDAFGATFPRPDGSAQPQAAINANAGLLAARRSAFQWLDSAMRTVQSVYPFVNWGKSIPEVITEATERALESWFYLGEISEEEWKEAWRRYYRAHL